MKNSLNRLLHVKLKTPSVVISRVAKTALRRDVRRLGVLLVAIAFIGAIATPVLLVRNASAYTTFTQDDWSGGVGADPANQYQSANNINAGSSLTVGSATSTSWCSTASCNTGWTHRKMIDIYNNSGSVQNNKTIKVNIAHDSNMRSDFADLRFTNEAGTADVAYWLEYVVDDQYADVYLKPASLPTGASKLAVYFGNNSAVSMSDGDSMIALKDTLDSGTINSPWQSGWGNYVIEDGVFKQTTGYTRMLGSMSVPATNSRIIEFDLKMPAPDIGICSDYANNFEYRLWGDGQEDAFFMSFRTNNQLCQAGKYYINNISSSNSKKNLGIELNFNAWYRFRAVFTARRIDGNLKGYYAS
ncbi:DUF2341 domain-containing protein, partial [Candidatus Saccharibacteria bacterium]|nr:DUF2341 domain-containing protein [Candidatus Saccharibacteria bacterium]